MTVAYQETAVAFGAADAPLIGIVTMPNGALESKPRAGVLIVVGGPQYRVGSHRQFVLLARALAARGLAVMRFDCSGMGDSGGTAQGFEARDDDLRAALDAFFAAVPSLADVTLWGLCDAASAVLFYALSDARVKRLALANPWVRSDAGLARTHLKHYYAARLFDAGFWRALFKGEVGVGKALAGFAATLARVARRDARNAVAGATFQTRMANGWRGFSGEILLICSGDDLTAHEFLDHVASNDAWRGLIDAPRVTRRDLDAADHTFSRAVWRDQVAGWTADWVLEARCPQRARTDAQADARTDAQADAQTGEQTGEQTAGPVRAAS